MLTRRLRLALAVPPVAAGLLGFGCSASHAPMRNETPPEARVVAFAPGIRLDYRIPQVEIDAQVILRQGPLELFAYSKAPVPKEHETILLLDAPAESVYQALGLIGLTPGRPPSYNLAARSVEPATGDALEVCVRYDRDGRQVEHSAAEWMTDAATGRPPTALHWVFAGSRRDADGRFLANVEGTAITVVDFEAAVVALAQSHTSANKALWLTARPEAIPPLGTPVTLLLRPVAPAPSSAAAP